MTIEYLPLNKHPEEGRAYFVEHWRTDTLIVSSGDYHFENLNGLIAMDGETVVGLITYAIHGNAMTIVSLNSVRGGKGIGKQLLTLAEEKARMLGLTKMDVSILNDNLQAMAFFQRHDYRMSKILRGSADIARERQPQIPVIGDNQIPIHDEVLLTKIFPVRNANK